MLKPYQHRQCMYTMLKTKYIVIYMYTLYITTVFTRQTQQHTRCLSK